MRKRPLKVSLLRQKSNEIRVNAVSWIDGGVPFHSSCGLVDWILEAEFGAGFLLMAISQSSTQPGLELETLNKRGACYPGEKARRHQVGRSVICSRGQTTRYLADASQTWKSELGKAYGGLPRCSY
jgi:hypothetical protein